MKKKQIFFLALNFMLLSMHAQQEKSESTIEVHARHSENGARNSKVKLLLGVIADEDHKLDSFITRLAKNLEFSGQLEVVKRPFNSPKNKREVTDLFEQGYPLILFNNYFDKDNSVEYRLYDATQAEMVKGKKYSRTSTLDCRWAHGVAQELWPELSQDSGIFLTKIAYIKKIVVPGRTKYRSQVCIADFDGGNEKILLDKPTIYVELSFHPDTTNPRLLVSEFTAEGSRLIMLDFYGNKKVVLGGDKSITGASVSNKAYKAIYKESGDIWKYNFDPKACSSRHELVIRKKNKCSSATLCPNDDIIYCSDGKIYRYESCSGNSIKVIEDGIAPSYCAGVKKICYSQRVNGILQLMLFDEITSKSSQVTFDKGNKSDSCFSPCGNYLIFCHEKNGKKYIACLVLSTGKQHIITSDKQNAAYPAWSPIYSDLLP